MLMQCGAMKYIIPELFDTVELTQNKYHFGTVFEHTIKALNVNCIDRHQYLPVVLALLLHDIGKIYCKTKDDKGNVHKNRARKPTCFNRGMNWLFSIFGFRCMPLSYFHLYTQHFQHNNFYSINLGVFPKGEGIFLLLYVM